MNVDAVDLLVTRTGTGTDEATAGVTRLYRGHSLGLMRLALVMTGDRQTAEDVVQESFLGLYRRWPHLRDREKALTYVRSAVLNGCRSASRRQKRRLHGEHLPPVWSAESEAMVGEDRREVMAALHRLPI